jgi:hypothetical protein
MGLAVVGRLAERHDLQVSLHRRLPNGTTATVLVPPSLVTELPEDRWSGAQTVPTNGRQQRRPVPEPREGAPVPPSGDGTSDPDAPATSPSGLPRRGVSPASAVPPSPVPRPPAPTISGTTASGLPRRVSRSIKDPAESAGAGADAGPDDHEKFLADLGDFADGEQAARAAGTDGEST